MRLLVVTQYFHPENFRVNELVAAMVARGHEVTVLTGLPNYPAGRFFPGYGWRGPYRESIAGAEVVRVPLAPRGRGNGWRLALNYLSFAATASLAAVLRLPRRHDAIFVFEPSPVTVGLPAIAAAWACRAPILFWVLDLWPQSLQATGAVRSPKVLALTARLVRWIYARCALVLMQSRGFAGPLGELGVPAQRLRYFPNWIEAEYEQEAPATGPPGRPDSLRIVYAGNIGAAQDFPAIIEAAALLAGAAPAIRWVVAGDGRMAEWLRSEVSRRKLDDRFELLGHLPARDMPGLFAGADALLVSLRADPIFALTIPGKVQSYLASGRPVLAMLDGEGAKVVEESGGGWSVPAGDAAGLAAMASRLAGLPCDERAAMGRRARDYARREFGRQLLFDRLEGWLRDAVGDDRMGKE